MDNTIKTATKTKNSRPIDDKENENSTTTTPGNWKLFEEIVYIISHDLQIPLISIEGYANELEESYKDILDQNGTFCLERLKANTRRMHRMVLSLLDLSRLNTHQYPHEPFKPTEVVKEIIRKVSSTKDITGINIDVEQMPGMQGDKRRLAEVFRHLITNALIYGGKNITIGCCNGTWFVKDDGIGIPPNQLEKIFKGGERLKRVDVEGVGMGLTFCKYVIFQHGGRIWAESDGENKGAAFYFILNT